MILLWSRRGLKAFGTRVGDMLLCNDTIMSAESGIWQARNVAAHDQRHYAFYLVSPFVTRTTTYTEDWVGAY